MKKYLYSIVLATLILISTTAVKASNEVYYINRENVEMTEREYNNLVGLGFTEKQIERMDEQTFLENKDINGTVLSEVGKYIKKTTIMKNGIKSYRTQEITKEEALAEVKLQSQKQPTRGPAGNYYDGVFATQIIYVKNKIVGISNTYMRFKTDIDWLIPPSDRHNDILGIGFESNKVYVYSSIVFREDWLTTNDTFGYNTICVPKTESTGGSAIFALPSDSLSQLEAYIYFNVKKKSGVGTITELYTSGTYAHADTEVNMTDLYSHYSVGYSYGINVDSTYAAYFDYTYPAYASFVGTW